jgi:biopolymer transport protein ExbB
VDGGANDGTNQGDESMKGARLHVGWLAVCCLLLSGAWGLAQAPAPAAAEKKAPAAEAKKDAGAKKEAEIKIDDIEDIANVQADTLAEQMEEIEEGDHKEFKVLTDDNIATLAVGDIYRSGPTFFKVKVIGKQSAEGGAFVMERMRGLTDPGRKWDRFSGSGPVGITSRVTLLDLYIQGGPFLHPIAAMFAAMVVLTVNSLFLYRRKRLCPDEFVSAAESALEKGDLKKFAELARTNRGLMASICRAMSERFDGSTLDDIRYRIEAAAGTQIGRLRIPIRALNLVAVAAPLLGLLGTIIGMVIVFEGIAGTAGAAKASLLASGIRVKLFSTASALMVAIPSLFFFFIFNQKLNTIIGECELITERFMHLLSVHRRQSGPIAGGADSGQAHKRNHGASSSEPSLD